MAEQHDRELFVSLIQSGLDRAHDVVDVVAPEYEQWSIEVLLHLTSRGMEQADWGNISFVKVHFYVRDDSEFLTEVMVPIDSTRFEMKRRLEEILEKAS